MKAIVRFTVATPALQGIEILAEGKNLLQAQAAATMRFIQTYAPQLNPDQILAVVAVPLDVAGPLRDNLAFANIDRTIETALKYEAPKNPETSGEENAHG